MIKVRSTINAFSIFRTQRTEDIRKIGFGEKAYFETRAFYLNAKKHGFKTGLINKSFALGRQWREINKGYPRGFTSYLTYRPRMQFLLYGKAEIRNKKMHVPDLDLDDLVMTEPKVFDKSIEPVDIILLTYYRKYYLFQVIDEIIRRTNYPYRLIVVDNGSTDGTRDWILDWYKKGIIWKYVFTKQNCTINEAFTEGFKEVESSIFVSCPDDIPPPKLTPCWLTTMLDLLGEYPEFLSVSLDVGNVSFYRFLRIKYGKEKYNQFFKTWRTEIAPKLKTI